jgi:type II secretory pathway component PulK
MRHRRRSMVLVLVLVVIALLALAAGAFARLMVAERRAVDVSIRQVQARASADSGVDMLRTFLVLDEDIQDQAGGWYDNELQFRGRAVIEDLPGPDAARFTIVAPYMDYDGVVTGIRFGLEDESARLNLNALMVFEEQSPGIGREILMGLPGMSEDVADAILDWMDPDDEPREFGAEIDYYATLDIPYEPKNGPPESVEELMLVRGIHENPWLLFGCDLNHNGLLDEGEPDPMSIMGMDYSDGSMDRGWAAYFTLYSLELNLTPEGDFKIDLNQDDLQTLYDELVEIYTEDVALFICAYRLYDSADQTDQQQSQYEDEEPVAETIDTVVPIAEAEIDLSQEPQREITCVLDLIDARVELPSQEGQQGDQTRSNQTGGQGQQTGGQGDLSAAGEEGTEEGQEGEEEQQQQEEVQILECPFSSELGALDYLPDLLDYVTVIPAPVIVGRVNINQAPMRLLDAIPGMDYDTVNRIITERVPDPMQAVGMPGRRYETWILTEGLVTLDQMKTMMPFVCASGSVYRAQVVGYFDLGGPSVRLEVLLDITTKPYPARVVFWRNISNLGRGFTLEDLGIGYE